MGELPMAYPVMYPELRKAHRVSHTVVSSQFFLTAPMLTTNIMTPIPNIPAVSLQPRVC